MRKLLLSTATLLAVSASARAAMPVVDVSAINQLMNEINVLREQYTELQFIFSSVAHPTNVLGMAPGLSMLQNPLGSVTSLPTAISGLGNLTGSASGLARQFLGQDQVYAPAGTDFMATWLNRRATSLANSQALATQYLQSDQARLQNLGELETEAQSATDVQQLAAVQARIQTEQQFITTQQAQAQQVLGLASLQSMVAQQQLEQNWRQGNDEVEQQTQAAADSLGVGHLFTGGGGTATIPAATPAPTTVSFPAATVPTFGGN